MYEGAHVGPVWSDLRGEELYDHSSDDVDNGARFSFDDDELVSVAGDPAFAAVKAYLAARLQREWATHAGGAKLVA